MRELTKADVPGMLTAVIGLAKSGRIDMAPAWVDERDVRIIAGHIGAADIRITTTCHRWQMQCPACGAWDFGTGVPLEQVVKTWLEGGRLPAGVMIRPVCMTCEEITDPAGRDIDLDVLEALRSLAGGWSLKAVSCESAA